MVGFLHEEVMAMTTFEKIIATATIVNTIINIIMLLQ